MQEEFSRTELLFGPEAMETLQNARVAVFGVGGVGGYVVEALARSGVGTLDLIDKDTVSRSNVNRQIIATQDTIGRSKVEVAKERVLSINPEAVVHTYQSFFLPETADQFDFDAFDYVVDAIDTVSGKIALVTACHEHGTPILCSMGAGNKMDPTAFQVTDLAKTSMDPIARILRKELRKRGIRHVKVVYSTEPALTPRTPEHEAPDPGRRSVPGSNAFVPSVVWLIIGGEVLKDLTGFKPPQP